MLVRPLRVGLLQRIYGTDVRTVFLSLMSLHYDEDSAKETSSHQFLITSTKDGVLHQAFVCLFLC